MDQQTQVGNFGMQPQVLRQQGYAVDEEWSSLDFYIRERNSLACMKDKDNQIDQGSQLSSLASPHSQEQMDEKIDECFSIAHPLLLAEDK
tara:strand:+ start:3401 stop:3670 length:270 start_codon:yes stop_codon:yes gene_type:complete